MIIKFMGELVAIHRGNYWLYGKEYETKDQLIQAIKEL